MGLYLRFGRASRVEFTLDFKVYSLKPKKQDVFLRQGKVKQRLNARLLVLQG